MPHKHLCLGFFLSVSFLEIPCKTTVQKFWGLLNFIFPLTPSSTWIIVLDRGNSSRLKLPRKQDVTYINQGLCPDLWLSIRVTTDQSGHISGLINLLSVKYIDGSVQVKQCVMPLELKKCLKPLFHCFVVMFYLKNIYCSNIFRWPSYRKSQSWLWFSFIYRKLTEIHGVCVMEVF